jgi:hypothetical protein
VFTLKKAYYFYPLLFICMAIDILSSFVCSYTFIRSLLCLFCVAMSSPISIVRITFLLTLLSIESFFFYGFWGVQLIYLAPLVLIAHMTWDKFTYRTYHALFLLTCCFMSQLIIDLLLGINIFSVFTIMKFLINIVLTISLSLTYI